MEAQKTETIRDHRTCSPGAVDDLIVVCALIIKGLALQLVVVQ
jgi:hypothetical protein